MMFVFALLVTSLLHLTHGQQGQLYEGEVQGIPCLSCDVSIVDGLLDGNLCAGSPYELADIVNCPIGQHCFVMYKTLLGVLSKCTRGCEQTCTETDDCMRDDSADCVRCCNSNGDNNNSNSSTGCNTWVIDPENLPSGGVRVGEAVISLALALMLGVVFAVWG